MAKVLLGNIKGPKGDPGPQGEPGPQGPAGPAPDLQGLAEQFAPAYTYGTEDLEAGTTPLATGKLHFVYE